MEQRHKEINDLITKIAIGNPAITKEQIARARAMYNGDNRPIEEIAAELEAYSKEIRENARLAEMNKLKGKPEAMTPTVPTRVESEVLVEEMNPELAALMADAKKNQSEELVMHAPQGNSDAQGSLADEENEPSPDQAPDGGNEAEEIPEQDPYEDLANMLAEAKPQTTYGDAKDQKVHEAGIQYVKKQTQDSSETGQQKSSDSDGGYGNPSAILTIAIFISIMAIIIGFFTIIAS